MHKWYIYLKPFSKKPISTEASFASFVLTPKMESLCIPRTMPFLLPNISQNIPLLFDCIWFRTKILIWLYPYFGVIIRCIHKSVEIAFASIYRAVISTSIPWKEAECLCLFFFLIFTLRWRWLFLFIFISTPADFFAFFAHTFLHIVHRWHLRIYVSCDDINERIISWKCVRDLEHSVSASLIIRQRLNINVDKFVSFSIQCNGTAKCMNVKKQWKKRKRKNNLAS